MYLNVSFVINLVILDNKKGKFFEFFFLFMWRLLFVDRILCVIEIVVFVVLNNGLFVMDV